MPCIPTTPFPSHFHNQSSCAFLLSLDNFSTFCMSCRRCKMYCGHARLCVCLSVCLSAAVCPRNCTDPDVTWGSGRGCPLVVHCWADLQSMHGFSCSGNITRTLVTYKLASIPQYDNIVRTLGGVCARCWTVTGHRQGWGSFSTSLRRPGLRASNGGILPS